MEFTQKLFSVCSQLGGRDMLSIYKIFNTLFARARARVCVCVCRPDVLLLYCVLNQFKGI